MDFADIKARISRGVQRADLAASYGDYVNEALREIQNRRSWTDMKFTVNVALPASDNENTVTIASDFKELQKTPAVYFVTDDGGLIPAETVFESQQIYRVWVFWGTPIVTWPPRIFFERNGTSAVIGMVEPRTEDFNFRVDYFRYLPDLVNDTDTSPLLTAYPEMVLAKSKVIAFTDINDEEAMALHEGIYEKKFMEGARKDAYAEVRGRTLHL
jgi:hypothetical protein